MSVVEVTGTATFNWTAELPKEFIGKSNLCADPVVEAVLEVLHDSVSISVFGRSERPITVHCEMSEDDVEIGSDQRGYVK